MLSKSIILQNRVYEICKNSEEIFPNATFRSVCFADESEKGSALAECAIVCCGNINDNEMLFRTEDGRCYFSIRDGRGMDDGILYGLKSGIFFDFEHPTKTDSIAKECEKHYGSYSTFGGAMAYHSRKHRLDTIRMVMLRVQGQKTED